MQNSAMQTWLNSSHLTSVNLSYIEQLYEDFLTDPRSVNASWRLIFKQLLTKDISPDQLCSKTRENAFHLAKDGEHYIVSANNLDTNSKQIKVLKMINAFRLRGHQQANLDPLNLWKKEKIFDLDPNFYNFTESDFQKTFNVDSFAIGSSNMKLADLYEALKKIYCGAIGIEYMHITDAQEIRWIQKQIESMAGQPNFSQEEKKRFLSELTAAEGIERYLGTKFPGAKRFSLEGGDALIPMLKEMVRFAGNKGIKEIVLGMAHRGRLNVLINVLGKKPQDLFDEFSGKHQNQIGTGDVKYHQGFSSIIKVNNELIHVMLAPNPSHLEIINPVVMGLARARIDRFKEKSSNFVLPIVLHGDAAISGQGVVQETLNMSKVRGYDVGGTVHVVINNQVGFTTSSFHNARSTQYCTDIIKMIQAPIFHINADDLEAVVFATRVALNFRNTFKRDVMIDLVCYRRHGHNEADEPSATQPLMYQKIKKHPTPRKIYANCLERDGIITQNDANEMIHIFRSTLEKGECVVKECQQTNARFLNWQHHLNREWKEKFPNQLTSKYLQSLAHCISEVPISIKMQSQVAKIYQDRAAMARGEKLFDWGSAEMLAYATLINEGISVRLSGEDTARGTFFHRHAIVYNQKNGLGYNPLSHVKNNHASFKVWDSVLSEEAVLAFEYGYATAEPSALVIWEAQFGDFANGAQIVIDQFICSGEQKWGQMCGLVMLLPHGYEGQGPEHSSARLERYLQLCAEQNMQVCIPSTPAQVYHVLRRQALCRIRRPLIIMSPKSLLRHPLATSSLDELANGKFQPAIDEIDNLNPQDIKRVVLCSGKVYYDLLNQRRKNKQHNVVIIRVEQLYPFPIQALKKVLSSYTHVKNFVWCQEEPQNQGAWCCSQPYFREVISKEAVLNYVGRSASASTAVGYLSVHQSQQKKLVNDALNVN